MIVCRECGHTNDSDDDFCGSCGAFLEWAGEPVEEAEPEPEPLQDEPVADASRPGLLERVKAMVGVDTGDGADSPDADAGADQASTVRLDAPGRGDEEARAETVAQRAAVEAAQAEVERAAREAAEARRAAQEAADAEVRARSEQEARREAEARAQAAAEAEASAAAEARARQQALRTSREEAERAAHTAVDAQTRQDAEARAREAAEAEARQRGEADAREVAEAEARQRAETEAHEVAEAAERASTEADTRRRAEAEAAERARRAAALVAKAAAASPAAQKEAPPAATRPRPAATSPAPSSPRPQQPRAERERSQPTTRQPPSRTLRPGDLVCGSCGEGNPPARNFCRRCGHSLAEATPLRIPWWRRLIRRRKKVVPAGARPGRARRGGPGAPGESRARVAWRGLQKAGRRLLALVLAAAALLALVGAFVPAARPWRSAVFGRVQDVYDTGRRLVLPRYVNVHPVQATASSHLPGREPAMAIDRIKDFSWAEGAPGDGVGEQLVVTFAEPVDIYRVGISSGSSQDPSAFTAQPRPRGLHLLFSDGSSADLPLQDTWEFQSFDAGGRQVTEVVIRIDSVYGSTPDGACAIREIEFFTKA